MRDDQVVVSFLVLKPDDERAYRVARREAGGEVVVKVSLTPTPTSCFDRSTETRIALPAGAQVIIDTQRFWHATWHPGPEPRYSLITSWESGAALDTYIEKYHGTNEHTGASLDNGFVKAAEEDVQRRLAEPSAALSARGQASKGPQKSEA